MLYRRILYFLLFANLILITSVQAARQTYDAPFRLDDGLVMLQMKVNNQFGWFVFDSGAPGIVLNSNYFNGEKDPFIDAELHGLHGQLKNVKVDDWSLEWLAFEKSGKQALICDLSYLENNREDKILGLVGLDVFQGYYVKICFKSKIFSISKSLSSLQDEEILQKIPLRKKANLCTIEIETGGDKISLVFDSGSESNILDQKTIAENDLSIQKIGEAELVGSDGNIILTDIVEVPPFSLGNEEIFDQEFIVSDLSNLNGGAEGRIDGIVGKPFFANRCLIVDKFSRFIYLSKTSEPSEIYDQNRENTIVQAFD